MGIWGVVCTNQCIPINKQCNLSQTVHCRKTLRKTKENVTNWKFNGFWLIIQLCLSLSTYNGFLCVQCQVYGPVMDDRNDLRGRFLLVYYKEVAIAFHEDVRFMQTTKDVSCHPLILKITNKDCSINSRHFSFHLWTVPLNFLLKIN